MSVLRCKVSRRRLIAVRYIVAGPLSLTQFLPFDLFAIDQPHPLLSNISRCTKWLSTVLLQAMKEEPPAGTKCKDKFLVQSAIITPDRETKTLAELVSHPWAPHLLQCNVLGILTSRDLISGLLSRRMSSLAKRASSMSRRSDAYTYHQTLVEPTKHTISLQLKETIQAWQLPLLLLLDS